jgi:hypothetical protein
VLSLFPWAIMIPSRSATLKHDLQIRKVLSVRGRRPFREERMINIVMDRNREEGIHK